MSEGDTQRGYVFALPRVIAKLFGAKPRRAEWSGAEAYGVCALVFGITYVFSARELLVFVRPWPARLLALFVLPFAVWVAFLLLYYVISLLIRTLRQLRLYKARTNDQFQHVVIMLLTTAISLHFLRDPIGWISALGVTWFLLLGTNIFCIFFERILDEP